MTDSKRFEGPRVDPKSSDPVYEDGHIPGQRNSMSAFNGFLSRQTRPALNEDP